MRKYWLMDQHGADGPTALVETDGSLHVIDVLRFGPDLTELEVQQKVCDQVMGRVAPTMRPFVDAASLDEEGVAPHPELRRNQHHATQHAPKSAPRRGAGRATGGARFKGGQGDR